MYIGCTLPIDAKILWFATTNLKFCLDLIQLILILLTQNSIKRFVLTNKVNILSIKCFHHILL